MKKIAFFDFDGTITTKDTMFEIIRFRFGRASLYLGMLSISLSLIKFKLGLIRDQRAKEILLSYFFRGMKENDFDYLCRSFYESRMKSLIRPEALDEIATLRNKGFEIVVVTASPSAWVRYWTDGMNIDLISSEMEIMNGTVTGKLAGRNCNNAEKVNRIRSAYNLDEYGEIQAFGDSRGDKAMLELATHPHYKKFD